MDMLRAGDEGVVILEEIAALGVVRSRAEAAIAAKMLTFADLRRRESSRNESVRVAKLEASFAADELGLVLRQPTGSVQCRLGEARRVRNQLPRVWAAWSRGEVDGYRVHTIAEHANKLIHPDPVIALDEKISDFAGTHAVSQIRAKLRRFIATTEPGEHVARSRAELKHRSVYVAHDADGVSWLHAMLPTVDAVKVDALLTKLAKLATAEASASDDARTLEQRRADTLTGLLLGRVDSEGHPTGASRGGATIGVVIPLTSLAGLDEAPGVSFDGASALPAPMIRDLATEPDTLFYRLLTDPAGHLLDVTETGRFPSRKLRTACEIRDDVCQFPTCSRPAAESDQDHDIPHPRGPTVGANLGPLCRRHHRMKTHDIVTTDLTAPNQTEAGQVRRWHLPSGETADSDETTFETGATNQTASRIEDALARTIIEYAPRHRAA